MFMFLIVGVGIRFTLVRSFRRKFRGNRFIERFEDVFCVDESYDSVEVYGTAETFVDPEKGGEITRVSESSGFEKDVIESTTAVHECFDGVYAGISRSLLVLGGTRGRG